MPRTPAMRTTIQFAAPCNPGDLEELMSVAKANQDVKEYIAKKGFTLAGDPSSRMGSFDFGEPAGEAEPVADDGDDASGDPA